MPLSNACRMVAILSSSSLAGPPQTGDMRIQPNPSLDTRGPPLPKAIFVIFSIAFDLCFDKAKIGPGGRGALSPVAQITCLDGSGIGIFWVFYQKIINAHAP